MADVTELIYTFIVFIIGIFVIKSVVDALDFQLGSLYVGFFIALGIAWFIKEVFGK